MKIEHRPNAWLFTMDDGTTVWISHPKWWLIGILPCIVTPAS